MRVNLGTRHSSWRWSLQISNSPWPATFRMKKTTKFLIWKFRKILMHLLSQICQNKWWALELLSVAQHISAELQANREESFIRAHIPIDQAVHTSKIGIQGRKITKATPQKVKKKREALFKKMQKMGDIRPQIDTVQVIHFKRVGPTKR